MRRRKVLVNLIFALLSTTALGSDRIVAIQGDATIEVQPDLIKMEIIVENLHKNDVARAKAVVDDLSSKAASVLIAAGVEPGDISSSTMTIDTEEHYDRNDNPISIGHLARREIDVTVRNLASYSKILQALVDVGVTRIVDVRAEVSDYDRLRLKAMGEAAKDARSKAEFLANELDAKLARVHRIGDHRVDNHFGRVEEIVVTASKVGTSAPYEFQPGKVSVNASIHVEFELE